MNRDAEPIARLRPSPARRAMTVGMPVALALVLVWVALATPPTPGWRLFLLATAAVALWLANRAWQATRAGLVLTEAGLAEEGGRMLAPIAAIRRVDRGPLAFKPSGGFLVELDAPGRLAWAPGLWWRLGRRLGVGGATNPMEGRAMADLLTAMLARRDGGPG
jgi:hypothetical protein